MNRVAFRAEIVDDLGRPQAHGLPRPAVMPSLGLLIALEATTADHRVEQGSLRHATARRAHLRDETLLPRCARAEGGQPAADVAEMMSRVVHGMTHDPSDVELLIAGDDRPVPLIVVQPERSAVQASHVLVELGDRLADRCRRRRVGQLRRRPLEARLVGRQRVVQETPHRFRDVPRVCRVLHRRPRAASGPSREHTVGHALGHRAPHWREGSKSAEQVSTRVLRIVEAAERARLDHVTPPSTGPRTSSKSPLQSLIMNARIPHSIVSGGCTTSTPCDLMSANSSSTSVT